MNVEIVMMAPPEGDAALHACDTCGRATYVIIAPKAAVGQVCRHCFRRGAGRKAARPAPALAT